MFHLVWIFIALILIGICLVPIIFFLITLQNTFKAISPQNRRMDPTQVWLCLIPLFGLGWNFYVLDKLSDSIQAELRMRGMNSQERPVYGLGLAYCILSCCCIIPFLGYVASLPAIVLFILYWIKVADFKTQFERQPFNTINNTQPQPQSPPDPNIFGRY